ncbi:hypothetical protein IT570_12085 [Candidatus Sumerlaeota bacterium]|nr:hypothetical protein [Candidatus Sumerlaeota bacterium]
MAKRKTRRIHRRFFRGLRVYLPLIFLIFMAMVIFLPLSAGWMARRAEREILKRTGLKVKIDQMEVTIAEGRVVIGSARAKPGGARSGGGLLIEGSPDAPPFRVERVELEGSFASLLGGNESWPSKVTVDGLPPVLLEKNKEGSYELEGAFRGLLDRLHAMEKKEKEATGKDVADDEELSPRGIGHTPRIVVRSLPIAIDPIRKDLPAVSMTLDRVELDQRPAANSPFRAKIDGIAMADSLERFSLNAIYLPSENRAGLQGKLSGVSVPFHVRPLGGFTGRVKNLAIDVNGRVAEGGKIEASLNAVAGHLEIAQDRLGGERWEDEPVEVRIRGEFNPREQELKVAQLSLSSAGAKFDLNGAVALKGDLPGEAHMQVDRMPRAALALLQNELTERMNITIDATDTSPTLQLEGSTQGDFARPETLNSFASVHAEGWTINAPAMPAPVVVRTLNMMASRDDLEIRDVHVDFSGMKIQVKGAIPICNSDVDKVGEVTLTAEGNTETIFDFLSRKGLTPPEINYARLPASMVVRAQGRIECDNSTMSTAMKPRIDGLEGSLTWKQGEIGLRDFTEPIRLEPGRIVYDNSDLALERFSASAQHISVKADGKVSNLPLPMRPSTTKPVIEGTVSSAGDIPDLVALLNRHLALPSLPRDLAGQYQLTLSGKADTAALSKTDYTLRLLLDKVSATVDTPSRPVRVADFSADMNLNRDVMEVRRSNLRIHDEETGDTTLDLKLSADRTAVRVDGDARTKLEMLPSLLPRDLKDMYMKGTLPANGWARFTPRRPLDPDKSLVEAWVGFLKTPGLSVDVKGEPDLLVDFELANKQEEPVEIFPRDFPVRISNIRGSARFTPEGIILREVRADFGSAKDVLTSGTVKLGRPVIVDFSADIDQLDANEWMTGWGEREWAAYSASFEPRWKSIPEPYQTAIVNARIRTNRVHFLRYDGDKVSANLHFESWSRIPDPLNITEIEGFMYGGPSKGDLKFELLDHGEAPRVTFNGEFNRVDLKPFMDALYERDQKMDGLITAQTGFSGQLMNYPTYKGEGKYTIERSSVIGNVILDYARGMLELTSTQGLNTSTIIGTVSMYDQKVFLPNVVIRNPNINLTADGYLDFRGRLFFDVTASVLAKQLQNIPLIRIIGNAIDVVGNQIVSYELRGTLKDPRYRAVLTPVGRLMSIREVLKESQKEVILPEQEQMLPAPVPATTQTSPRGKKKRKQ